MQQETFATGWQTSKKTANEFAKPTNVRIKLAEKEKEIKKEEEKRKMQQETRREEIKLIVYA